MNIFKLVKGAKFDYDQIKEENFSGIEIFNFFVSDHLNTILPYNDFLTYYIPLVLDSAPQSLWLGKREG